MFCRGFGSYGIGSSGPLGAGLIFASMAFRLAIFIGLIVLAVKLLRRYTNNSNATMRILDEKFARGEISEEEYLKRRTILSQRN